MDDHAKRTLLEHLALRSRPREGEAAPDDLALREALRRVVESEAGRPEVPADVSVTAASLARRIDHTALKPETTEADVRRLCAEAAHYGFASVCVNPCYVPLAAEALRGVPVAVCTVVGFPLGATLSVVKAQEAEQVVRLGATEVDVVINVGMLKGERYAYVQHDVRTVVEVVRTARGLVKVILETALLTDEEKVAACLLAREAGADFVKTSTGFSKGGATTADVALLRRVVGDEMGVKAAGGIRTYEEARAMIAHGATRLGASASVAIVSEIENRET